jgi:hypothetical protein
MSQKPISPLMSRSAQSLAMVAGLFQPEAGKPAPLRSRRERTTPTLLNMLADWFSPARGPCHRASCRRRTYCGLSDSTGLPRCIGDAPEDVFAEYVRMFNLASHFATRIRPGTLATWHGRLAPDAFGLRQLFCIGILHMALPDDHPLGLEFATFWAHEWPRRCDEAGTSADAGTLADPDAGPGACPSEGPPPPGPECF